MAKFCGNCGKEVDPKAVICVNCGSAIKNTTNNETTNTNKTVNKSSDKKGLPWWAILLIVLGGLGVIVFILLMFILAGAFSFVGDAMNEEMNDIIGDTYDKIEEKQKPNEALRGTVRDTLDTDNISLTLLEYKVFDVLEDTYSSKKAADGKEFIVLFFRVKNNSDESIYVSNYEFDGYEDDRKLDNTYIYYKIEGYSDLGGSISSGKYNDGYIVYEVSKEWKEFEVHFTDDIDFFNETDLIFKISNDKENEEN